METDFVLFGPRHWLIIVMIPAAAFLLWGATRDNPRHARAARLCLGWFLTANEFAWYAYRLATEGVRWPGGLPLNLCDLSLWLAVLALLTVKPWAYEPAWFAGIGGAAMAVLTPELWAKFWTYPTLYFFTAHGGIITAMLFLVWSGQARPGPRAMWRGLLVLNGWGAFVAAFNACFGTNYMYLCAKPSTPSLLDYLGPWPWYVMAGEAVAAAVFSLLALPFRNSGVEEERESTP